MFNEMVCMNGNKLHANKFAVFDWNPADRAMYSVISKREYNLQAESRLICQESNQLPKILYFIKLNI